MRYEWWIAKRYLWSKRRHPFVGVISTISVLGICVGVAALIVVLAVMSGFDEDLKSRIIGMRSHLVIEKDGAFDDYSLLSEKLEKIDAIAGVAPFVEGQALVQQGEWGSGVLVRGVDTKAERTVSRFFDYVKKGTLSDNPGGVVVGSELAKRFHLGLGSQFLIVSQMTKKPELYTVKGIFSSGMYDYDANLIFLNLKDAQNLFELQGAVSGLSVSLKNADAARDIKMELQKRLKFPYDVRTWMELNKTLFGALRLEKIVMFLILALIILVACLNIAGSLTLLVMDKTKDIGVLKSIGATPLSLMKVFAWDGLLLGFIGTGAGFVIGTALCFFLKEYSLVDLPKEIYYLDRLPVKMNPADVGWVLVVAVSLSLVSAIYPARVAGGLNPVKALRYE